MGHPSEIYPTECWKCESDEESSGQKADFWKR